MTFDNVPLATSWRHYKGGVYIIVDHVILSQSDRLGVTYQAYGQYYAPRYVHALDDWFTLIDGVPRFRRLAHGEKP